MPGKQEAAIILMNDDGPDDFLSRIGMKWLNGMGLAAMAVGPEKGMKGLHSWPLENVENAVCHLKGTGYKKDRDLRGIRRKQHGAECGGKDPGHHPHDRHDADGLGVLGILSRWYGWRIGKTRGG